MIQDECVKRPTIKTIAKIAGVTHVTVSRALRDYPDIAKSTRERIKAIADEVGYIPNAFARSLSTNRALCIGMIVPSIGPESIYGRIFEAISAKASHHGLNVLLGSCGGNDELEKDFVRLMCENRVGTLIISPISGNLSRIKEICKNTVPIIFLGGDTGPGEKFRLAIDYTHSQQAAVSHLHALGHRRVALALYPPETYISRQKILGYRKAVSAYGITPEIYYTGESSDPFQAGILLAKDLLDNNSLPTALCCADDLMALGVINELNRRGIDIPRDISIIGHDDLYLSCLNSISLTTFAFPHGEIADKTLELATNIMNSWNHSNGVTHTLTASLIERGTVLSKE